ncbi:uncharacterized protein LOC143149910 isoform X2 [Ptiloglossa arizonensis]|uniref:uncharacterized protein LOC143149910 isoform X2 n=1 Tax=Ptiloglossa arizonensis TaxID=3350558 RepID=UPI003F9FECF6
MHKWEHVYRYAAVRKGKETRPPRLEKAEASRKCRKIRRRSLRLVSRLLRLRPSFEPEVANVLNQVPQSDFNDEKKPETSP